MSCDFLPCPSCCVKSRLFNNRDRVIRNLVFLKIVSLKSSMESINVTANSSGVLPHSRRSAKTLDFALPYTAASGTFSLVGGGSNVFVMFILLKYVGFKQNTFVYMFSLFFSDFLYNCVVQPQVCYYQFPSSVITPFGMNYIHAASLTCILSASFSLLFASLDQYIFIKLPFSYGSHITKKRTLVVVFGIWLVSFVIGVIRFHNILSVKDGYLIFIAVSFVLTILLQLLIFFTARDHNLRIQQIHRSLEHNHPRGMEETSAVRPVHESEASNKAAKTIGFLLAVFIASWLPVNIYRQEYRWNGGDPKLYHKWVKIINLMIQLHSCINPWVFVLRSKDMKVGVAKFLNGLRRCFGRERSSVLSHNLTLSTRVHGSRKNILESRSDSKNDRQQESLGKGNDGSDISGKNEKTEGHSLQPCGSANVRGNESISSRSGNINRAYDNDVTLEDDEIRRGGDNSSKALEVNVEEGKINGVCGNIKDEENCGNQEKDNGNDDSGNDVIMSEAQK